MLTSILYFLTILIAYTAPLKWFLPLGIRLNYFEVLILLYLAVFFIPKTHRYFLPPELKRLLILLWVTFGMNVLSGIGVLLYPFQENAGLFYLKGLVQYGIYMLFFTTLVCSLLNLKKSQLDGIISAIIASVVCSSVYGCLQLICELQFSFDLDRFFSESFFHLTDSNLTVERFAYGGLYRISGISHEPSTLGATIITVYPLLMDYVFRQRRYIFLLLILLLTVTIILSMSVSSITGLLVAVLIWLGLSINITKAKPGHLLTIFAIILSACWFYFEFRTELNYFAEVKLSTDGSMQSHAEIAINTLKIAANYPAGLGFNNFSIAYEVLYNEKGFNSHNSWLTYLVESGVLGLLSQISVSLYFIWYCLSRRSPHSNAFVAAYIGVCVASAAYELKSQFSFQFYTMVLFSIVCIEIMNKRQFKAEAKLLKAF